MQNSLEISLTSPKFTRRGSALLLTLLAVSLLMVLVLGMVVMVRLELRRVVAQEHLNLARSNARLALELAVAELQVHAGPDQRATGTSGLLDPNPDTDMLEATSQGGYAGLQHPNWTGVWRVREDLQALPWESGYDPHPLRGKGSGNPKGQPAWLVSGNWGLQPGSAGYQTPTSPAYPLPEADDDSVWLLQHPRNPSATPDATFPLQDARRVVGRIREVPAGASRPASRFAYHVFDEGVKATLQPYPLRAGGGDGLIAQRWALEKTERFAGLSEGRAEDFTRLAGQAQLGLLPDATPGHRQDFTLWNASVQADAANGGLRRDLSVAFDMPDADFNQAALFADSGLQRVDGEELRNGVSELGATLSIQSPHRFAPIYLYPARPRQDPGRSIPESAVWGPTWHLLRDYARLHLPRASHGSGYVGTQGDARVYRGRGYSYDTLPEAFTHEDRVREHFRTQRVGDSVYNETSTTAAARQSSAPLESVPFLIPPGTGSLRQIYRPTTTHMAPVVCHYTLRWAVESVPATESEDNTAGRRSVRLVIQPALTLWNPYNAVLEVDVIKVNARPSSASEYVIEAELEPWVAGRHYREEQEVVHNGSVYRYGRSFSASALEPGAAGSGSEWTWLSNSGPRTEGGGVWGVGAMGTWTQLGNKVERNHYMVDTNWVLVSRGTEVDNTMSITRFAPIRFEPGEVKFFGAHATAVVDGNDPVNTYNGMRYYLLREGSFFPNAGLGFTELRSSATKRRLGTGLDAGPQLLEGVDGALTIHEDSRVRVSLGSWGMGGEAASIRAGTALRQFYGNTHYHWSRHVGNDTNRLKVDLGLRRPDGVVGRNVFIFNQFPNSTFTELQLVDKSFENRFRYQGADDQWAGTIPPLLDRAMVYPATPLSLLNLDSVGQFEQYLKSDEDATQWPFRVLAAGNPRFSTYNHNLLLRNTDVKVGYFGAHGFLQLKHEESGLAPNFSPIPQVDGKGYYGASHGSAGEHHVMLFDVPRAPLLSLGRLQHAGVDMTGESPAYVIGNSELPPYLAVAQSPPNHGRSDYHALGSPRGASGTLRFGHVVLDHSWLANNALFDGFFFSSLQPWSDAAGVTEWWLRARPAPNARMVPVGEGASPLLNTASAHEVSAALLLTHGTLNVNSVSVEAWRALLASLNRASVDRFDGNAMDQISSETPGMPPLPRAHTHLAGGNDPWNGARLLSDAELDAIASELVREVKRRGPFLSLSDFVNRRLVNEGELDPGGRDIGESGRKGALQSAIDRSPVNAGPFTGIPPARFASLGAAAFPDTEPFTGSDNGNKAMAHAAGYLTQADVLQALAPSLASRSDTFMIRVYGEHVPPGASSATAKAWAQAVVQRMPDYVEPSDAPTARPYRGSNGMDQDNLQRISPLPLREGMELSLQGPRYGGNPIQSVRVENNLHPVNRLLGRGFRIVSFQWLNEEDL